MSLKVDGTKYLRTKGRLAQLVEQDVYTIKVGGSSPSSPTKQEAESEYLELSAFMFYVPPLGSSVTARKYNRSLRSDSINESRPRPPTGPEGPRWEGSIPGRHQTATAPTLSCRRRPFVPPLGIEPRITA